MTQGWYNEDLAFIHDAGFVEHARCASPEVVRLLHEAGVVDGLIVDLGCGSGVSASAFVDAGYSVLGVDISESMIAMASARVPDAEFQVGSMFDAALPRCAAVTSIGECLNYLFDPAASDHRSLVLLFERVHAALRLGGLFVFDLLGPGQVGSAPVRSFREGDGWLVLVEKTEHRSASELTRRIITLREVDGAYRRRDEVHRVRLYRSAEVVDQLEGVGFDVHVLPGYAAFELPEAHAVFVARKGC